MRHLLFTFLFSLSLLNLSAQQNDQSCSFGITFEISNNPNWGYGEPVIVTVDPESPAAAAGIKAGDIIMEINGGATYLRDYRTIQSWLSNGKDSETFTFTIRNLNSYFKEYELPRKCQSTKTINESYLANSFAFYSLENNQSRKFTLPLKITTNKDVDYSEYHTFNFLDIEDQTEESLIINTILEKQLIDMGLIKTDKDPDIWIQTSYSYAINPKYDAFKKTNESTAWRFDTKKEKMVPLPIASGNERQSSFSGKFALELGIRFFDRKYISRNTPTQIWDASIREYLTREYPLSDYLKVHIPLIMMRFPYSEDKMKVDYLVKISKYNYTGICFNMDDLKTITSVDHNSPAYNAGIRPGMEIKKINNEKFIYSTDEIMNGYKRFIVETMKLRDPSTSFVDANNYPNCMYWSRSRYPEVAKAFQKTSIYVPSFSYLYGFESYVSSGNGKNILKIETNSNVYSITPKIKKSVSIQTL